MSSQSPRDFVQQALYSHPTESLLVTSNIHHLQNCHKKGNKLGEIDCTIKFSEQLSQLCMNSGNN